MSRVPMGVMPLLGAALALSACASTATPTTQGGAPLPGVDGSAAPGVDVPSAPGSRIGDGGTSPGADAGNAVGSGAGGAQATAGPSGSVGGTSLRGGSGTRGLKGAARIGRGVTDTVIRMGAIYLAPGEQEAVNNAAGVGGDDPAGRNPNAREEFQILTQELNKRGGIGGRKIQLFAREVKATDGSTFASISQAACEYFVRDAQVAAVMVYADIAVAGDRTLSDCLAKAGVAQLNAWYSGGDERHLQTHPLLFEPHTLNKTRIARLLVDGLAAQGYYKDQKSVGVLAYDTLTSRRAVDEVMRPRLKALGVEADVFYLSQKQSVSDSGKTAAETNSAVLRFRSRTQRVVILGPYEPAFLFMQSAASQGYEPKYGLSSENQPADLLEDVPAGQLDDAVGVGYAPYSPDTSSIKRLVASDARKAAVSAGSLACWEMYRRYGYGARGRIQLSTCDIVFFWADAVKRGLPHLDGLAFKTGAESIGDSFVPAWISRLHVGPGRHDGATVWRPIAYMDSCRCLAYSGGERRIP